MRTKITLGIATALAVACSAWLGCDINRPRKSELSPPATPEELAQFRIVANQNGAFAIQQSDGPGGTNWMTRPNRWQNAKQCQWDIDWWIANTIRNAKQPEDVWTPR